MPGESTAIPKPTGEGRVTVRCGFCRTLNRVELARADQRPRCADCSRPILLDRPVRLEGEDFTRTVEEAGGPVLVDFYADWCGPCKMMAPALDDLASRHAGSLLVAKLDTDRWPGVAGRFGIRGIPTLILFDEGREVARETGAIPAERLEALLAAHTRIVPSR
ncbi:MAG: thioredoxin [Candidatus Palauibacterales bacterium]|nr:thioredoxin [Candidatus Palauibacterales bacterium]MDP2530265.1 thioredoxin [Candidatus Palauibacterales bacterium]MDP2583050.1 thioredoxin [Candidatus Palauibacterales bacterium]